MKNSLLCSLIGLLMFVLPVRAGDAGKDGGRRLVEKVTKRILGKQCNEELLCLYQEAYRCMLKARVEKDSAIQQGIQDAIKTPLPNYCEEREAGQKGLLVGPRGLLDTEDPAPWIFDEKL